MWLLSVRSRTGWGCAERGSFCTGGNSEVRQIEMDFAKRHECFGVSEAYLCPVVVGNPFVSTETD